jgi:hypothetical protein
MKFEATETPQTSSSSPFSPTSGVLGLVTTGPGAVPQERKEKRKRGIEQYMQMKKEDTKVKKRDGGVAEK